MKLKIEMAGKGGEVSENHIKEEFVNVRAGVWFIEAEDDGREL